MTKPYSTPRTKLEQQVASDATKALKKRGDYSHVVREYRDGRVVLDTRNGFSSGDVVTRVTALDENGTVREVTTT